MKADATKDLITSCAREEFLDVGFHNASLRKIAAAAGVTTGAIYRYFPDKKALYAGATGNALALMKKLYAKMSDASISEASESIAYKRGKSEENIAAFYNLIYDYFDEFYLLLMGADSAEANSFLHEFVGMEEESTLRYIEALKTHYGSNYEVDTVALHFLLEAYVTALFEPVRHRMSRCDAIFHAQNLSLYFSVGWLGLEDIFKTQ